MTEETKTEKRKKWFKNLKDEQKEDYCLFCIEALASTYRMIESSYKNLCDFYTSSMNQQFQSSSYQIALAEAWMFIDSYALFSRILHDSFFSFKKDESFTQFNEFTAPIRDCRNYHFHIDADNQYKKSGDSQIMGNLTWVTADGACITPVPSISFRKNKACSVVFDSYKGEYVSRLCLWVNNQSIDFDSFFDQVRIIKDKLITFFNNDEIAKLFNSYEYVSTSISYVMETEHNVQV